MKLLLVAGARPNFMKIAALVRACKKLNVNYEVVHTGQHYDEMMSEVFFKEFELDPPDYNMVVGSGTHAQQTAKIIEQFEPVYNNSKPDIVVVVGDVNSTLGCSIVVSKIPGGKLAHVEAGLRSYDREMPEEVNRIVTDCLSDYLFCPDKQSYNFLKRHNDLCGEIHLVGDVMIDNLLYYVDTVKIIEDIKPRVLVTIHRQSNTDNKQNLESILKALAELTDKFVVTFPIHPRTKNAILKHDLHEYLESKINFLEPLGYLAFLRLLKSCDIVLTDSGSLQIETSILNKRCLTLRENTERPETTSLGTNEVIGTNTDKIVKAVYRKMAQIPKSALPGKTLYDGKAAERIIEILRSRYES
jgi:UDP-N-acetylglucosamine 2-epimerase (non-hydrolysing)